jgi:hypothetical protein
MNTRITAIALGIVVLSFSNCFSQFRYGPHFGTTFTSFAVDNTSLSGNLGFVLGATVDYDLTPAASVVVNLDYNQIRGGLNSPPTTIGGTVILQSNIFTLHTAEVTGLGTYRFPIPFLGSATPKIVGGVSGAYNFFTQANRSISYFSNDTKSTISGTETVTDSFAPILFAGQAGLQFEFLLSDASISSVVFDIRYRRNINSLMDGLSLYGQGGASDVYSNSLIMTIGFKLN